MLEIRPNCEYCDKDLAPDSLEAMICTYECTFCTTCVSDVLENVCPNCGGNFAPRPIRPKIARRPGLSLEYQPASTKRVNTKYQINELQTFSMKTKEIKPEQR
ncbi:DUF1272 domain-containing protein [Marinomonas sp. 15G1-11]|uniref:DUF1272 domain-containing protein n=1 Tax=Marinomonas phaeophyticola TaxID=3004091 RepID=A0ABT4JUA3_9GAMM|nr:DUF1272 domain-containing protein [Marinomonas sp. 15G1-11]MCZ2721959.1 DUF1272 domain-containing protein [Marinomonas sp. 15G1-11]